MVARWKGETQISRKAAFREWEKPYRETNRQLYMSGTSGKKRNIIKHLIARDEMISREKRSQDWDSSHPMHPISIRLESQSYFSVLSSGEGRDAGPTPTQRRPIGIRWEPPIRPPRGRCEDSIAVVCYRKSVFVWLLLSGLFACSWF